MVLMNKIALSETNLSSKLNHQGRFNWILIKSMRFFKRKNLFSFALNFKYFMNWTQNSSKKEWFESTSLKRSNFCFNCRNYSQNAQKMNWTAKSGVKLNHNTKNQFNSVQQSLKKNKSTWRVIVNIQFQSIKTLILQKTKKRSMMRTHVILMKVWKRSSI